MTDDSDGLELESIGAVVWVDDDGTRYRRTFEDGEVIDTPVGDADD